MTLALIETIGNEMELCEEGEGETAELLNEGGVAIARYGIVDTFTFGHAPADETIGEIIATCAVLTIMPVLRFIIPGTNRHNVDVWDAMRDAFGYSGSGWAEDPDVGQALGDELFYGIPACVPEPYMVWSDENTTLILERASDDNNEGTNR